MNKVIIFFFNSFLAIKKCIRTEEKIRLNTFVSGSTKITRTWFSTNFVQEMLDINIFGQIIESIAPSAPDAGSAFAEVCAKLERVENVFFLSGIRWSTKKSLKAAIKLVQFKAGGTATGFAMDRTLKQKFMSKQRKNSAKVGHL